MRSKEFLALSELYARTFPDAELPDSRGMALEDFDILEELMREAIERGSPISEDDLRYPIPELTEGLVF